MRKVTMERRDHIQIIDAEMWLHVTDNSQCVLEGPAFDRNGDLYFVDVNGRGKVYRVKFSTREIEVIYDDRHSPFAAVKIHKDGRLFLCGLDTGTIVIISSEGALLDIIHTVNNGRRIVPDDMVFDNKGNFYFTSLDSEEATGGVYRVSSDLACLEQVIVLDNANGISLSPDGRSLWVSETHKRVVRFLSLDNEGRVDTKKSGLFPIPEGEPGYPDSNQVDSAGNLYQAMFYGARLLVVNDGGLHIADVVLPEPARKGFGRTTNLAFRPGTDEGFITTAGEDGGRIYRFKALAKSHLLYSHY